MPSLLGLLSSRLTMHAFLSLVELLLFVPTVSAYMANF